MKNSGQDPVPKLECPHVTIHKFVVSRNDAQKKITDCLKEPNCSYGGEFSNPIPMSLIK